MEKRNLTCIGCPMGCALTVEMENGEVQRVSGHPCNRGDDYARNEVTYPTRIVTSSVYVTRGAIAMVSGETATDIPKEKIMDIMASIEHVQVKAPIKIGDVIVANAADTGVDIIATKDIAAV